MINVIENSLNYSSSKEYYTPRQLQLPLDWQILIEKDDPVRTFKEVMEGVNLGKYLKSSSSKGRKGYNHYMMLELVLFGFMDKSNCSLRDLEKACKTDVRYMWLAGNERPSHVSFANFINENLKDTVEDIFVEINKYLIKQFEIDTTKAYIDGTKIEANANKYTFIWKKATYTFREKLYRKIDKEIEEVNKLLNCNYKKQEEYLLEEVLEIVEKLNEYIETHNVSKVTGKGHKKDISLKLYKKFYDYYINLIRYIEIIKICGKERNSYSKTDKDATFMHLKEDYMKNGQLKPAYNLQHLVCDEFILAITVSSERDDYNTFIPTLNKFKEHYGFYPTYPVADSGYGSQKNYQFLKDNKMELYTKYSMYSKDKENDGSFLTEFIRLSEEEIICPNNKIMRFAYLKKDKKNTNQLNKIYICEDCVGCPFAKKCKNKCKDKHENRRLTWNEPWELLRREAYLNLQTDLGNELKIKRSIQVEGSFGILKQDMEYRRLRRKGIKNVKTEFYLNSIAFNLRKVHHKLFENIIIAS